jgi:hypothetical protein
LAFGDSSGEAVCRWRFEPRRGVMAVVLKKLSPPALWDQFAEFVAAKKDGTFKEVAAINNYADEEHLGLELHAPALRLMVSLAEILLVFGRHHWGEPDHLFERSKRDRMSPAKNVPVWLGDFLYPQGIPTTLYRVVGWNRKRKQGGPVIGFAYVDAYLGQVEFMEEYPVEGGGSGSWEIALTFGVLSTRK